MKCPELEDHDCKNDQFPVDPKFCSICCCSGIPTDLWGLMAFIPESSTSWVMSSENHQMISEPSWESGEIPADWKLAIVIPIFKKGKKEDPETTGCTEQNLEGVAMPVMSILDTCLSQQHQDSIPTSGTLVICEYMEYI
ncbi:hypothetical protein BTVI_40896 [Pitangus sulphuratus]|nr:hypothetical protein BTVI_40896 [Pitangus sulphuratus]